MNTKKILLLFADLDSIGGLQIYSRWVRDALNKEFNNIIFFDISLCETSKRALNYRQKFFQKILFIFKCILYFFRYRPEFLICTHVNLSPIALLFKKFCGLKYAVLTHGIEVWDLKCGIRYSGLKNADVITTVSRYTKERMVRNGIRNKKIKFLPYGINTSLFYKKNPERELLYSLALANRRVLLTVGRLSSKERYKGHDVMLEVLQKLDDEYVWLVVGGGDDLPRLQNKAREMGVAQKTRFLGEIQSEKLVDYYNLCNVFVMPSKGEGFGIVFLEAMACGKPVIAGNRDGSSEPLMNGRLGFLVDPDSNEEIIQVINYVFMVKEDRNNPDYLIQEVKKNFGIENFNKQLKEIFVKYLL